MKRSAGLLLYRRKPDLEVLLVHPGGPFFARHDVWGIPKGEYLAAEEPLAAAYREFAEETGFPPPKGDPVPLGEVVQRGGKRVVAWALEGDLDVDKLVSNTFQMPWRGRFQSFPEIDEGRWFTPEEAVAKMSEAQRQFVERLLAVLEDVTSG
ncbi:MAG TPA: NUDIX domain-containing protein [Mycobacteriales bacterium]|nr:NUDIX domain-containing protein [Mycobacteriales bacterium]